MRRIILLIVGAVIVVATAVGPALAQQEDPAVARRLPDEACDTPATGFRGNQDFSPSPVIYGAREKTPGKAPSPFPCVLIAPPGTGVS
jgi:hypothetical protein